MAAWLSTQARAAGLFGTKLTAFSWLVAAILLLSFLFRPIAALLVWIIVCISTSRRSAAAHHNDETDGSALLTRAG